MQATRASYLQKPPEISKWIQTMPKTSTPQTSGRRNFCRIVFPVVVIVLILVCVYDRILDRQHESRSPRSYIPLEFLHRNQIETGTNIVHKIGKELLGYVWPKHGSKNNRIRNQMNYINEYAQMRGDNTTNKKIILRVGDFNFLEMGWVDGQELLRGEKCPITDCWFTSERSVAKFADALLISEFGSGSLKYYTPKPPHQIWIAQHSESPPHNRIDPTALNNLVNWTVTYRLESTIVSNYGAWEYQNESTSDKNVSQRNYAAGKTKQVAMFVSNCNDKNGRLKYAKKLSEYIKVDIYGACGSLSCAKGEGRCIAMLKDYKFYLAFENSNCVDYITEKFHGNALTNDVIPIVMGARPEDYAVAAPPGSFIHVDNFQSPRHLADYLKLLSSNDTLYNEYFRFKESWKRIYGSYWCRICALLHVRDDAQYVHWYKDYDEWWNGACRTRQDGSNRWQTWRSLS